MTTSQPPALQRIDGGSKKPKIRRPRKANPEHKKLPQLPKNALVSKRPLNHPAISSAYAGASHPKVIYVSANTPFLSAVKRVEKLLHLADKRLVQSATTVVKQQEQQRRGVKQKRGNDFAGDGEDGILDIAREVERRKADVRKSGVEAGGEELGEAGEEVVLKGTGKAIQRVLELGLWFQQREEYAVRLRTGTVGAVDDVEVVEGEGPETSEATADADGQAEGQLEEQTGAQVGGQVDGEAPRDVVDLDAIPNTDSNVGASATDVGCSDPTEAATEERSTSKDVVNHAVAATAEDELPSVQPASSIPETRIRYVSVLEVYVCKK